MVKESRWLGREKEELSKRLEVIRTTSEPALTPLGGAFAAAILLVPLGFELLKYFTDTHRSSVWFAVLCFFLVCSPFLLVAATWLFWRPSWNPWQKRFWTIHRKPYSKRSLLALFLNKTQERTLSNAVRTPDPTSVEFQSLFGRLIEEVLQESERRLLVVVDNLDRVEASDALTIWATLKTFFDFDAGRDAACFARLWLLVPFDEIAICKLWATNGEAAADLGQSFVDKTFQTIFRVSPPVLSDWQDFLNTQLKIAFPDHDPADFHRVYRIYDLCAVSGKEPPTPRDIKLFVNSLGATHRQWQDEISLPLQALYTLLSKDHRNLAEELALKKDEEILSKVPVDMVEAGWRESLAAIHFNVPKERALQVMVGGRITGCIASGDGRTLKQLASITGFTRVLERQIEQYQPNWGGPETKTLAVTASNLAELTEIDDNSWNSSWRLLRESATKVKRWAQFDGRSGVGLVEIVRRSPEEALVDAILSSVSDSFPDESELSGANSSELIKQWFEGTAPVLTFLQAHYAGAIERGFAIRATAQTYFRAILFSASDPALEGLRHFLRPTAEPGAVVGVLSALVGEGKFDSRSTTVMGILKKVDKPWPWESLVAALAARLNTTAVLPVAEVKALLETLTDFCKTIEPARKAIEDLIARGLMSHHLHAVAADEQATALCALPILRATAAGRPIASSAPNSAAGMAVFKELLGKPAVRPKCISRLAELIIQNNEVDMLYEVPPSGAEPFLQTIFREIVNSEKGYQNVPPNRVVGNASFLKAMLGEELFEKLVDQSVAHANLVTELTSTSFALDRVGIYRSALRGAAKDDKYLSFLLESFRSLDTTTWLSELSREGELLDLLTGTAAAGPQIDLTSAFDEALFKHAQLLMEGKVKVERLRGAWDTLVDALDKNFQVTTLKRVIEIFCQSSKATDSLLELYGSRLAVESVLSGNEERLAVLAFPHFLARLRVAELGWLCTVLSNNPNFLSEVTPATRETLEIRIVEAAEQPTIGEEAKRFVERLTQLAGINIEESKNKRKPPSLSPEPAAGIVDPPPT